MSFGTVGQYETIVGRATGEVDPSDPLNAIITDVQFAPRNTNGRVEYSMDVVITKPVDMSKGNGTILHDVPNRGAIRSPEMNIGGDANNVGDGFLESQGFTLVDNGWEGDINTGLRITLPVARNPDGSDITGGVRSEYILTSPSRLTASRRICVSALDSACAACCRVRPCACAGVPESNRSDTKAQNGAFIFNPPLRCSPVLLRSGEGRQADGSNA